MIKVSEFFDEKKDPFYQKGEKVGLEKGISKGIAVGKLEGKLESLSEKTIQVIVNLIQNSHHNDAFIGQIAGSEPNMVAAIRAIMAAHPADFQAKLDDIKQLLVERVASTGDNLKSSSTPHDKKSLK